MRAIMVGIRRLREWTVGQILLLAELAPRTVAGSDLSLPDCRTEWSDTWTEVSYELDM